MLGPAKQPHRTEECPERQSDQPGTSAGLSAENAPPKGELGSKINFQRQQIPSANTNPVQNGGMSSARLLWNSPLTTAR